MYVSLQGIFIQSTAETIKGFRVRFVAFNYVTSIAQNNRVE